MVVKFFSNKKGGSNKAIDYLLNAREQEGTARVLQGDKEITRKIINSIDYKQKVTVGCLNFTENNLSDNQKRAIMEDFEKTLLPGLDKTEYNILWVEHTDKQNTELNFVIPKIHLESKKSLNPYYHKADLKRVDTWQNMINLEHNLSNPKDLERKRTHEVHKIKSINADYEQLDKLLHNLVNEGTIKNRDHLKELLTDNGYTITRSGKDYISLKTPESKRATKMKGAIYNERFTSLEELREVSKERSQAVREQNSRDTQRELRKYRENLNKHIQDKSEKLRKLYPRAEQRYPQQDRQTTQERTIKHREPTERETKREHNTQVMDNLHTNSSRNIGSNSDKLILDDTIRDRNTPPPIQKRNRDLLHTDQRGQLDDSFRTTANRREHSTYKETQRAIKQLHKQLRESDPKVRVSSSTNARDLQERTRTASADIKQRIGNIETEHEQVVQKSEDHIRGITKVREQREQRRVSRDIFTYTATRELKSGVEKVATVVQQKQDQRKERYQKAQELIRRSRSQSRGMTMER